MANIEKADRTKILKVNHPAVIQHPDPNEFDYLDCNVVKSMDVAALTRLKLMLSSKSLSALRVHYQIKILTAHRILRGNYQAAANGMDRAFKNKMIIVNLDEINEEKDKKNKNYH